MNDILFSKPQTWSGVLRPAKPKVVLADGLTLRQARRFALQTLEAATSCGAIASEQVIGAGMNEKTLALLNKWRTVNDVARAFAGWYNANDVRRFVAYLDRQYRQNVLDYPPAISPEEEELYFAVMAWLNRRIIQGEYDDALGELYMLVGYPNRDRGQFFTPWHLARLMAEMQMPEDRAEALAIIAAKPDTSKLSVYDPACGSGVMLCAAWDVARERGYADLVEFYGTDIDPYCVVMARVNLIMRQEIPVLVQGLREWQALAVAEQMMRIDRQLALEAMAEEA